MDLDWANFWILIFCVIGLLYSLICALMVKKVKMASGYQVQNDSDIDDRHIGQMLNIGSAIEKGAKAFLFAEYIYIGVFIVLLALIIFFFIETTWSLWTTGSFVLGAVTSIIAGYIGMRVATYANYRCAYQCTISMSEGLKVAYAAGCVMGFSLVSLGVLFLQLLITLYTYWYVEKNEQIPEMYEKIAGYGLGASSMALFGRVGGGIYTKAADVGADLVGKVEQGLSEDSPQNPATIADNVGDNVGDIAGMGSDLFGSFAESSCAALVICSQLPTFYNNSSYILYPVMIMAISIPFCMICSVLVVFAAKAEDYDALSNALKVQLILSTVLNIIGFAIATWTMLPDKLYGFVDNIRYPYHAFICVTLGLVCGLVIGLVTEYYTSKGYRPVQELAESCQTGAATNIIYGLALGNLSSIIPIILLAITILIVQSLLGMFGVALAALGMLSNLPITLAIDAYGPVSDNAGGIAEMCELGDVVRSRTDDLDAAGNTTAAIGKGFAIGSAGLVSLALYGAFLTKISSSPGLSHPLKDYNIIQPITFFGLMIGAMLPYAFSALTMKSVGKAALKMVNEIRQQIASSPNGCIDNQFQPDYQRCIKISTEASLAEMTLPAMLVLKTPFIVGMLLGAQAIVGLLPGALISGVAMAISSANAGGAWDNAKKYIEAGQLEIDGVIKGKKTPEHAAAVIGDTVGDPLKDTSGPALNILVKLMAIFSLVFYRFFDKTSYMLCWISPVGTSGCTQ